MRKHSIHLGIRLLLDEEHPEIRALRSLQRHAEKPPSPKVRHKLVIANKEAGPR